MKFFPIMMVLIIATSSACASTSGQLNDRAAITGALADAMEANYVFAEVAQNYGAGLREGQSTLGNFEESDREFSEALTAFMQQIHFDAHLRIFPPDPADEDEDALVQSSLSFPNAIEDSRLIAPEIAYIRFNLFPADWPGNADILPALQSFIERHSGVGNLIIDVRGHRGGGLSEIDLLNAHLFSEETLLLVMDTRVAAEEAGVVAAPEALSFRQVDGPDGVIRRQHWAIPMVQPLLSETRVFVLISDYTASAAEHLIFALQRTGRATLIGEASRGGGHFGGTIQLPGGYAVFVPVGRTFDPNTGEDWEGDGVAPDIAVPTDDALIVALVQSGVSEGEARALNSEIDFTPPRGPRSRTTE